MEWNQIFNNKQLWQRNTFYRLKNNLFSTKNNRFIEYDNSHETHLVIVYGKTQVGKTTLILNMIGLKQDKFTEVYDTLRAGISKGNSSTSTAIIYSKSPSNQYGCAISSIYSTDIDFISFYNQQEMVQKLKDIRSNVESNNMNINNILYIYIPCEYFRNDNTVNNVSIMDLPGVESRNKAEKAHVEDLMLKYIPLSTVCVVACRANEIQLLETLSLPNDLDWMNMPHKFLLVLTNAYSVGNIKSFFNEKKRIRTFYSFINDTFSKEIKDILGVNNSLEVYPVDIGESFERLCNNELCSPNDINEVITTRDEILLNLRSSIVSRKGDKLKSAIMMFRSMAKKYGTECIEHLNEEKNKLEYEKERINKILEKSYSVISLFNNDITGNNYEINELNISVSAVNKNTNILALKDVLTTQIKKFIENEHLYKETKNFKYIYDKEKKIVLLLRSIIESEIRKAMKDTESLLCKIEELGGIISLSSSILICEINEFTVQKYYSAFYPEKEGRFSKKEKVFLCSIDIICKNIAEEVNEHIKDYINYNCVNIINALIQEKDQENKNLKKQLLIYDNKIKRNKEDIKSIDLKICEIDSELKYIIQRRNDDLQILNTYLEYANEAYNEQRKNIVDSINSNISSNDKMLMIFLLGLLDKDFHKVVGDNDE